LLLYVLDHSSPGNLSEKVYSDNVYANLIGGCSVFLEEKEYDYDEEEEEFPEDED